MIKNYDNIPAKLKDGYRFCTWRKEMRNGKPSKVPYNPMTGERAQSNNPDTFSSFTVATMAAEDYDGIGVGIFGDLAAIDLDNCLKPDGTLEPWAEEIVQILHAYTEVSPSKRGLRLLFPVTQPFDYNSERYYINRRLNKAAGTGIEIYVAGATKKYVTVTGNVFRTPLGEPWEQRNQELREVMERFMVRPVHSVTGATSRVSKGNCTAPFAAPERREGNTGAGGVPLSDAELVEKARKAKNGADFSQLWDGNWEQNYGSQSNADMALCAFLAFWTRCDASQMDRLFRQSGLYRDKWNRDSGGGTYGQSTIQRAIQSCQRVYEPAAQPSRGYPLEGLEPPPEYAGGYAPALEPPPGDWQELPPPAEEVPFPPVGGKPETPSPAPCIRAGRLTLTRASDVPYEEPRWVVKPYLQIGKGTLIQGDNGAGKTALVCALVAHVSTGEPFLGIPVNDPGSTVICSVEDEQPVLRGRLEESGANLERCIFVNETSGLTLLSPDLEQAIKAVEAKLLIIDPFQAFLGANVDMNRANETRPVLAGLFEMCKRNGCACIIIAHTGKSSGEKSVVNRSLGSVDIPAAMRSIIHVIRHPDDPEERVAIHVKSSNARNGRTIHYRIVDRGGVQWKELSDLQDADFVRMARRKDQEQMGITYENEPLVQVFNQLITARPGGGFWSYADLKEEGSRILGFPPYQDLRDLRCKIDALEKDLLQKDGLIVTHGQKGRANKTGIRIERYRQPEGYQTCLEGAG